MKHVVKVFLGSLVVVAGLACGGTDTGAPRAVAQQEGGTVQPPPGASQGGAVPPVPASCEGKPALSGDLDWSLTPSGTARTVHVHVPAGYDPTRPAPVVLNFHGYTSNGLEQAEYSGMFKKSDEAGFVAVHPEGFGSTQSWNAGACCGQAVAAGVDDVALVRAILDELSAKLCIDTRRVFATGFSNGGFLSHRLACELSDRVAAIASVSGVLGVKSCAPSRPVPVMQLHGTRDRVVPFDGNPSLGFPSVEATVTGWAERNECTDAPRAVFARDDVTCTTMDACGGGSEVTLCTIEGGGHTWPGSAYSVGTDKTTQAIRATDAVWEFFLRHPLP